MDFPFLPKTTSNKRKSIMLLYFALIPIRSKKSAAAIIVMGRLRFSFPFASMKFVRLNNTLYILMIRCSHALIPLTSAFCER